MSVKPMHFRLFFGKMYEFMKIKKHGQIKYYRMCEEKTRLFLNFLRDGNERHLFTKQN